MTAQIRIGGVAHERFPRLVDGLVYDLQVVLDDRDSRRVEPAAPGLERLLEVDDGGVVLRVGKSDGFHLRVDAAVPTGTPEGVPYVRGGAAVARRHVGHRLSGAAGVATGTPEGVPYVRGGSVAPIRAGAAVGRRLVGPRFSGADPAAAQLPSDAAGDGRDDDCGRRELRQRECDAAP